MPAERPGDMNRNLRFETMKTHLLAGAVAVLMATTAFGAQAEEWVDYVSLAYDGGNTAHVTLGITNGATTANTAVVGPSSNSMTLQMDGHVKCVKNRHTNFIGSYIYFGAAYVFVDQVVDTNTLYSKSFNPSSSEWEGLSKGWITEGDGDKNFVVPLNQVKAGAPLVRFDPVEEFNKKMQAHINNGGSKLEFMQNDQSFSVQKVISMSGACQKNKSGEFPTGQVKVAQASVNIVIKYEGSPNLKGDINPIIAQAQPKGGFQAGYNPLTLTSGELTAFVPNYVGTCPADPKFRVKLKGGGEGQVLIRILAGNATVHQSVALDFANGELIYDFTDHLSYFGPASLNNKIQHLFKLVVATKDKSQGAFRANSYKEKDQLTWSHTCIPKLSVGIGGQGGIQAGGGAPNQTPGLKLKVQPINPDPDPAQLLKVVPQQSKPQRAQPAN
jgi:hypothetical protein